MHAAGSMVSPRSTTKNLAEALSRAAEDSPASAGAAPASAGAGGPDLDWKPEGPLSKYTYIIPDDLKAAVLKAADSSGVSVTHRNRLYAAMGRALEKYKQYIHPAILARWASCEDNQEHKFSFLQQWVKDPQFGQVKVNEIHRSSATTYKESQWMWVTKGDVYTKYSGWTSAEGKAWADKILAGASKVQRHPEKAHKNDDEMKIYRVLASVMEGIRKENQKVHEHITNERAL
jgi:hypothetical protein